MKIVELIVFEVFFLLLLIFISLSYIFSIKHMLLWCFASILSYCPLPQKTGAGCKNSIHKKSPHIVWIAYNKFIV